MMEASGFDLMTFTPSNFSNMRRDDRLNICGDDADLLIEHMSERSEKEQWFYFSFTKNDNSIYCQVKFVKHIVKIFCFFTYVVLCRVSM